ncbi:hypothetical protein BDZ89DRAFT_1197260 [Hymenopellis radicata]|nr:hypothetical protein BDZ89DRAFT_1197260 [Hymenopellis radicata]
MFIRRSLTFVSCFIIPALAAGEDFTIPSFWRRPNVTLSIDDRISAASKAIETVLGRLASDQFGFSGSQEFYGQLADFDSLTNQTTYKEDVTRFFTLNVVDFGYQLCVGLAYGYDAIRAYNTYQTSDFLDLAVASWAFGRNYTLSDEQASSGRTPVKSFDLTTRCGSASMAGGTFWVRSISIPFTLY